ncbi:MAG: VOC family protein [Planctomycetales bacterium]|nr:VOC family protein [Planctomycetales bacterium]
MPATLPLLSAKVIDHVTLVVTDLERSQQFYRDVLGMTPVERPAFGFPGLWFQSGNTQIHMNVAGEEAGRAGLPKCDGTCTSRGFHFAFEVDDCDAAAQILRDNGIEIAVGPKTRPDGPRQLYVYDPDDHLVEIFSHV